MPTKDKIKQASYSKKHYANNKDKIKAKAAAFNIIARKRNYDFVNRVKRHSWL